MTRLGHRALENLRELVRDVAPGDVIADRFELRELLGEGGGGRVFAATDRETQDEVAVKMFPADGSLDAGRFDREVEALRRVTRPGIVRYVAHGVHDSHRFVALERLFGCTLSERLAQGPLPVSDVLELGQRVAGALAAIHREGLAHRDVKPSNVFLVGGSTAKSTLLDFGLSTGSEAITATGALLGTPGYMAPEQVRATTPAGPPADLFALGCVLYECLAGRAPFRAATTELLLTKVLVEAPESLGGLRADTPPAAVALVARMLEKEEEARPAAEEVARSLSAIAAVATTVVARDDVAFEGKSADAEARATVEVGTLLAGKYRIEGRIGEGGMGIVFLARHLELGTRVAIKLLREAAGPDEEARFVREARAAAQLESEHVVRVLDVGRKDERTPFIVMEYLEGVDLARRIASGRVEVSEAVDMVRQACDAIAQAHAAGIVHRDLKPSNLFAARRKDGKAVIKVLDFGISKITRPLEGEEGAISVTEARSVVGSAGYMSPEQLQSAKGVDARTDIWSLGVVLYELLSGGRPFEGKNAAAIGAKIATTEPSSLRERANDVPRELERVILRCLEKKPDDRYATVAELARALSPFGPSPSAPLEGMSQPPGNRASDLASAPGRGSRRGVLVGSSLALSALVFYAAVLWLRATPSPGPSAAETAYTSNPRPAPAETTPPSTVPSAASPPEESSATVPPSAPSPEKRPSEVQVPAAAPAERTAKGATPPHRPVARPPPSASAPQPNRASSVVDIRDPAFEAR